MDKTQIPLVTNDSDLKKLLDQHMKPEFRQTAKQKDQKHRFDYILQLQKVMQEWEEWTGQTLLEHWGDWQQALLKVYSALVNDINAVIDRDLPLIDERPDCKPGCWSCCTVMVTVSPLEVIALAMHMKKSGIDYTEVTEQLNTFDDETKKVGDLDKRFERGALCPLLTTNHGQKVCGVYGFRPMPCRSFLAPNASKCKQAYRARKRGKKLDAPFFPHFLHLSSSSMTGGTTALQTLGLDWEPLELTSGLRIALETEDLLTRWFSGEQLFENARVPLTTEEAKYQAQTMVNDLLKYTDVLETSNRRDENKKARSGPRLTTQQLNEFKS